MRWLLLPLTLVVACRGDSNADVGATGAKDASAGLPNAATPSCPVSSSYEEDAQFRVTAALVRSATGSVSATGPTREHGIRDAELAPDMLAAALSNGLSDAVAIKTLVVVRRTADRCAPPTGERVDTDTLLAPGGTEVVASNASPLDSPTTAITIFMTGTTTSGRQIRTPAFVLPIRR